MRATITVVAADASSSDADADKEMEAMESGEAMDAEPEIEPEPEPVTVTSEIRDFALQNLTIEVGTTVTWVNRDPVSHTSTSGVPGWPSGLWDSELLSADASFSHTFSETGEFEFFCIPHNSFMKATVTVVDAS
jgi:plastocyanin